MTAPKQRVVWLVVDRDGYATNMRTSRCLARCVRDSADGRGKHVGYAYESAPHRVVRVTYPWPPKPMKRRARSEGGRG